MNSKELIMKYYLLTFNEDWADEHRVPALQCFNEKEYNQWLETKISEENPDYEEELKEYKELQKKYVKFWEETKLKKSTPDYLKWYAENYVHRIYEPIQYTSILFAYLGNSGDGFGDSFNKFLYAKELVENGIVKVVEVTEEFFNIFHKAGLAELSLCNVFEP